MQNESKVYTIKRNMSRCCVWFFFPLLGRSTFVLLSFVNIIFLHDLYAVLFIVRLLMLAFYFALIRFSLPSTVCIEWNESNAFYRLQLDAKAHIRMQSTQNDNHIKYCIEREREASERTKHRVLCMLCVYFHLLCVHDDLMFVPIYFLC